MAEVVLHIHVVQSHLVAPYQGIRQCGLVNLGVVVKVVHSAKPVEVLAVVCVGHLVLVQVKGRYRNAAWLVVPVPQHVFFYAAHSQGSAFDEDQARPGLLAFVAKINLKAPVFAVVERHTRGIGTCFDATRG